MKTILLILSAFVLSLAAGCALQPASTYQVYIDPMFSDSEQAIIRESLQDWTDKSEGIVTFNVSIAKSWGEPTPHTIWIQSRSQSDMPGHAGECYQSLSDSGFVYLPMDKYEGHPETMAWFGQTVRHEVGHALGLPHEVAGTIMAPSHGSAAMTVTCVDVANLAKLHGIPAGFAECK